jgi:hypothetical protein
MLNRPVGAELFLADGRTDEVVTKLMVAFGNYANAPNRQTSNVT